MKVFCATDEKKAADLKKKTMKRTSFFNCPWNYDAIGSIEYGVLVEEMNDGRLSLFSRIDSKSIVLVSGKRPQRPFGTTDRKPSIARMYLKRYLL